MRIALFLPSLIGGGAERVAITIAHELAARGYEIDFVLAEATGELLQEVGAARVLDLEAPRFRSLIRPLASYLRSEEPTGLLALMWPLTSIAVVARSLARSRTNLVLSDHSMLSEHYPSRRAHLALRASMRLTYAAADHRVVVSPRVASDLGRLSGLGAGAFQVIDNPVPLPADGRGGDEGLWSHPRGARVLTVGSLKASKRHDLILRAFARLEASEKELAIVGEGPERPRLESLARQLGVAAQVRFHGFRKPEPFYRGADLFVLASDYEGLPMVLIEALGYGLRVVSTDCPSGPREILDQGRFGTLVPMGDECALAAAIEDSLATPNRPEIQRQRASQYTPDLIVPKYEKLLTGRQSRR